MAKNRGQRIGIWIIAITMIVGTLAGFLAMLLIPQNEAQQAARMEQLQSEYGAAYDEYQARVDELDAVLIDELTKEYFDELKKHEERVGEFAAADVSELVKTDLKEGDGDEITSESTFSAFYIGWNPEGKIFDSSFDGEKLKLPLLVGPGKVIEGWTEGVDGMKVGGIRELTIPSDLAYGEMGGGSDDIPANTPLKFIIMIVPTPDRSEAEAIAQPEMSEELREMYRRTYGIEF